MYSTHSQGYLKYAGILVAGFKLLDGLAILLGLFLALALHPEVTSDSQFAPVALFVLVAFYLSAETLGLYISWRGKAFVQEFAYLLVTWAVTVLLALAVAYFLKTSATYSRLVVGVWGVTAPLLMGLWRLGARALLRYMRSWGFNTRTVAIMGASGLGEEVARTIENRPSLGYRLVGMFDDREPVEGRVSWKGKLEGDFGDLVNRARRAEADLIYIALPMDALHRITHLTERLADTTASVYLVPDFYTFTLFHGHWEKLGDLHTVSVFDTPFQGLPAVLKRIQDFLIAGSLLVLLSPLLLFIAFGIKASSPGPVLFKQRRYGVDGQEIRVFKFRTMRVTEDGGRIAQASRQDPRVTPLGAFLRRTSLDELPQLFNVLRGEMSVVGPRPHAVAHNEEFRSLIQGYMQRHAVKPGITGLAQVNGLRGATDTLDKMEKRVEHDLWYIRHWSLGLDLRILFITPFKGLFGPNAY